MSWELKNELRTQKWVEKTQKISLENSKISWELKNELRELKNVLKN